MKKQILASLFCLGLGASPAWATLIDAWDFAGVPATTATTATPGTISATIGTGVIDVSAFGLGSPQGTNPERTTFGGSTLNAFSGAESGTGTALTLANSSANGKSVLFTFSMSGYQDLVVSFATRGTATGFNSGTWAWSVNGIDYTVLTGVNTATRNTSFALAPLVDFSTQSGLDDAPTAYLKYTLDGATSTSGNNRLDNIQFNATPIVVPEPTSLSLLGTFGVLGCTLLRRRK